MAEVGAAMGPTSRLADLQQIAVVGDVVAIQCRHETGAEAVMTEAIAAGLVHLATHRVDDGLQIFLRLQSRDGSH